MLEDLEIVEKVSALADARCNAYRFDLVVQWRTWYDSSYVSVLHQSAQRAASLGMDINRTWFKLLRGHQLPIGFDVYRRANSTLQQEFSEQIAALPALNPNHELRLRHKLERWRF